MDETFMTSFPFTLSTSAYTLQKISDHVAIDDLSKATKLNRMATMRHYRATDILKKEFLDNDIELEILNLNDNNSNLKMLSEYFLTIEEILHKKLLFFSSKYKSDKDLHDYLLSYAKMLKVTRTFIAYLLDLKDELSSRNLPHCDFEKNDYLGLNICMQCGEVYDSIEEISNCKFCEAGLNHICFVGFIV